MQETFITKIKVNKVRNLGEFEIPLSDTEMRHLIITGKNGSGKTTLLFGFKNRLREVFSGGGFSVQGMLEWNDSLLLLKKHRIGEYIDVFFSARRNTILNNPEGIKTILKKNVYSLDDTAGRDFVQYLVNLKVDKSFAKDDNDILTVNKIDDWFSFFESKLSELFDNERLELEFDRKKYSFNLKEEGKEPYNFNQLSDGYSAVFNIITELIMRMEDKSVKSYDVEGVVLIDEIEAHLHIDLQKKILPFLTSFFPKVQFIVTTHSPFVISSISKAVIYDLEKNIIAEDLSGYSYDTVIESYFNADKYSSFLKEQVKEYERLVLSDDLNEADKAKLFQLKQYLNEIPKFVSDELAVKLQQIKLQEMDRRLRV